LTINDVIKYSIIKGIVEFDNKNDSFHYSIYDSKHRDIFEFDAKGSYIDAQGLLYSYIKSDDLKNFVENLSTLEE
jgi:hypothetical protein